jgi:hypothetical protein
MKRDFFIIFLFILSGLSVFPQEPDEKALVNAMHTITSQQLMDYVVEICDPKYEGRLTGTAGYRECAGWLASKFSEWGLSPAGDDGSWFQWFPIPYTLVLPDCGVSMIISQGKEGSITKHYRYVDEFMPGSTSGDGSVTAEVIYAGYGITAPELGYDDFAGIDVKGKIILIERESLFLPMRELKSSIPGINTPSTSQNLRMPLNMALPECYIITDQLQIPITVMMKILFIST